MSRTDKTAPHWVKACYYPSWLQESHDHRNGPCDLDYNRPRRSTPTVWYAGKGQRCAWTLSREGWEARIMRCGCSMCGWDAYEGRRRLKQRRAMRREAHDLLRSPWEWYED